MRAVIQRVSQAEVRVKDEILGTIGKGLVVLVAVGNQDSAEDAAYLAQKTLNLRIFEDSAGKMNRSVLDIDGQLLVVSQFTLFGDCRKGNRPSFINAAPPDKAKHLYKKYLEQISASGRPVVSGRFQSLMEVKLVNHGPVTVMLDSSKLF